MLARARLTPRALGAVGAAVALILTLGGFVFYNTNVLNSYRTGYEREVDAAEPAPSSGASRPRSAGTSGAPDTVRKATPAPTADPVEKAQPAASSGGSRRVVVGGEDITHSMISAKKAQLAKAQDDRAKGRKAKKAKKGGGKKDGATKGGAGKGAGSKKGAKSSGRSSKKAGRKG